MIFNIFTSEKPILRRFFLSICVFTVLYVDMLGAWSQNAEILTGLAITACIPAVYLAWWRYKVFTKKSNIGSPNSIWWLILTFLVCALVGSILSYAVSCIFLAWDTNPLYQTTVNGINSGKHINWLANFVHNYCGKDAAATAHIIAFIRNLPEALWAIFIFIGSEAIYSMIEQKKEIERSNLTKQLLTRTDFIHMMINVSRNTRTELRKELSALKDEIPVRVFEILKIQEDIVDFQRLRYNMLENDFTSFHEEIKSIMTLQEILKLRNPNISFEGDDINYGELIRDSTENNYMILPGIIPELFFNAYKYSPDGIDNTEKIEIRRELSVVDDGLYFCIENPIREGNINENSNQGDGTGLNLIEKRLALMYVDCSYSIETRIANGKFTATLRLPLTMQ